MAGLVPAMMQFDCNPSGGLRDLAVELQAQLVAGNPDLLAVLYLARENHLCEPVSRTRIKRDDDLAIIKKLLQPRDLDVDDTSHLRLLEAVEEDNFVYPVEEFGPERRSHDRHHLILHRVGVLPLRLVDQEIGSEV